MSNDLGATGTATGTTTAQDASPRSSATPGRAAIALPGAGKRVALMATCTNDLMFPDSLKATVRLLERLGCEVAFPPGQTCCGQMFTNSGYYDEAGPLVRNYVDTFGEFEYVVAPSASCVGSVRDQHVMLAEHLADRGLARAADETAHRTWDISELLVDVLGVTDVGAYFPHKITYHPSCHGLRILRLGDRPMRLLEAVRGMTILPLPDEERCCGFGGTFALKNADVSTAMAADKARHVLSTGAEYLVGGENTCLMNITGITNRLRGGIKPIHLVEVLASTEDAPYEGTAA